MEIVGQKLITGIFSYLKVLLRSVVESVIVW